MDSGFAMGFKLVLAVKLHLMALTAVATKVLFTSATTVGAPVMGDQGAGHSCLTRVQEAAVEENRQAKAERTRGARMAAKAQVRTSMGGKVSSTVISISSLRLGRSFLGISGEGQVSHSRTGNFALQSCRRGVHAALMTLATSGQLKLLADRCCTLNPWSILPSMLL